VAHVFGSLFAILPSAYDVYVSIPLRVERMIRGHDDYHDNYHDNYEGEVGVVRMGEKGASQSHGGVA
jgi:hypothetical protein